MPQRLLHLPRAAQAVLTFLVAALLMLGIAFAAALVIESRTATVLRDTLATNHMDWAKVETDGMRVTLSGTAPNEAQRFRALNLVGSVVDDSRVHDLLEVTPTTAITAPRFSVEMLRNDDGIQLIGLMPESPGDAGLSVAGLVEASSAMTPEGSTPTNMLQTANWPAPAHWEAALKFGVDALGLLKRSKISVSDGQVKITAIAGSAADKHRYEEELGRRKPRDVVMTLEISAPRPVITPFTLRFIKDAEGARFDACSADTERAKAVILAAGDNAGVQGSPSCTVGMGTPTPRWSEASVAAIRAVTAMGAGSVTFSDADISLAAGEGVTQEAFDAAVGDLRAALPDVFSLEATPPRKEGSAQGPVEFTAKLASGKQVEMRGRLVDETQQAAITAFARAAFAADTIHVATRLDPELPDGWPNRVLAGLESLSFLENGSLLVRSDLVEVTGVTGNSDANRRITQILSSKLGQGENFRVNVRYDKKLDPQAALPTPKECAANVHAVMQKGKITFTPGSAEIAPEASPVINDLAEVLRGCPGLGMEVAGHTDSQGSESGNLALSQARAESVVMALQGRRVDVSNMTPVGYGEFEPIADNGTEAGREANRRIEFNLKDTAPTKDKAAAGDDAAALTTKDAKSEEAGAATQDTAPIIEESDEVLDDVSDEGLDEGPDFSEDTSPSVAPTEKTVRPRTRPAAQN